MVVDSTDRERIAQARDEFLKMVAHEDLSSAHVLVFANKQDVAGALSVLPHPWAPPPQLLAHAATPQAAEIAGELRLPSLKTHSHHIQACCALTGEGLLEGMDWLSRRIKER